MAFGRAFDAELYRWELDHFLEWGLEAWKGGRLSPAEREVGLLLLKGLSLKEVAETRQTSERTVRQQALAVYRKAGLAGRAELMLDPIMAIWDCGPFPVIFKEAGGYFGSWDGREGHIYKEALACNAALLPEVLRIIEGK